MYEGFGIVILEAWALSKAVIASRVGGVPYIITDGADGLLYEWGDIDALAHQMESLLTDRDLAHKMGISGREKVIAKYTKSVVVSQIENIYEEVIHSNQHGKKS
jgi:glycosyltransferase involved in cell wall biosynthesis